MSNINYSKISTEAANTEPATTPVSQPEVVDEPVTAQVSINEPATPEIPDEPDFPHGLVTGCSKLNVRAEPDLNAKVVCVIAKDSDVLIDLEESTDEWYAVYVGEEEGFCMKKFITID